MNDLFSGDSLVAELLERIEALEAVVYASQRQVRVKAEEPLNEAWQLWNRHRSGKGWTAKARELSMKKLRELAGTDGAMAMRIVEQSIERGWTGLFAIKEDKPNGTGGWTKPEPKQIHKTVQEAFTPSESRDENHRAWLAQQAMYGRT
jgi:hypothetical protein